MARSSVVTLRLLVALLSVPAASASASGLIDDAAVGLSLANNWAAADMFAHRAYDRRGNLTLQDGRNAWTRIASSQADVRAAGGSPALDTHNSTLQVGSDVLQRGSVLLGVMLGIGQADTHAASMLGGQHAKGRVHGTAVGVYGTWLQQADGAAGAYFDASLQAGQFRSQAHGSGQKEDALRSRLWLASLEGGYTFASRRGARWPLQLQPRVLLRHADGVEAGAGLRVSTWHEGRRSLLRPYAAVHWVSGSMHPAQKSPGHELQAGADLQWGVRWAAWAGLNAHWRGQDPGDLTAQMGLRMAW